MKLINIEKVNAQLLTFTEEGSITKYLRFTATPVNSWFKIEDWGVCNSLTDKESQKLEIEYARAKVQEVTNET